MVVREQTTLCPRISRLSNRSGYFSLHLHDGDMDTTRYMPVPLITDQRPVWHLGAVFIVFTNKDLGCQGRHDHLLSR